MHLSHVSASLVDLAKEPFFCERDQSRGPSNKRVPCRFVACTSHEQCTCYGPFFLLVCLLFTEPALRWFFFVRTFISPHFEKKRAMTTNAHRACHGPSVLAEK